MKKPTLEEKIVSENATLTLRVYDMTTECKENVNIVLNYVNTKGDTERRVYHNGIEIESFAHLNDPHKTDVKLEVHAHKSSLPETNNFLAKHRDKIRTLTGEKYYSQIADYLKNL